LRTFVLLLYRGSAFKALVTSTPADLAATISTTDGAVGPNGDLPAQQVLQHLPAALAAAAGLGPPASSPGLLLPCLHILRWAAMLQVSQARA
jgi:hypothetical protein